MGLPPKTVFYCLFWARMGNFRYSLRAQEGKENKNGVIKVKKKAEKGVKVRTKVCTLCVRKFSR